MAQAGEPRPSAEVVHLGDRQLLEGLQSLLATIAATPDGEAIVSPRWSLHAHTLDQAIGRIAAERRR